MERIKTGYGQDKNGNPVYLMNHSRYIIDDNGKTLEETLKSLEHVSDIEYINQKNPFPSVGDTTRLYIDIESEKFYYWDALNNSYNRINTGNNDLVSSSHVHNNMEVLNKIKYALTDELRNRYDAAYEHTINEHAPSSAQKNIQSDWDSENDQNDNFILNKPKLGTISSHDIKEFATDIQGQKADSAIQALYIGESEIAKNNAQVVLPTYPTRSSLSINNVDDTSDLDKPISNAVLSELRNIENNKQNNVTGAATSVLYDDLTPFKVVVSDEEGKISASIISVDELSYMENASGNIQEQLDLRAEKSDLTLHISDKANPHEVSSSQIGLSNVTNESKETMFSSPVFTGIPIAPTPAKELNDTQIATTAFVKLQDYATRSELGGTGGGEGKPTKAYSHVITTAGWVKGTINAAGFYWEEFKVENPEIIEGDVILVFPGNIEAEGIIKNCVRGYADIYTGGFTLCANSVPDNKFSIFYTINKQEV